MFSDPGLVLSDTFSSLVRGEPHLASRRKVHLCRKVLSTHEVGADFFYCELMPILPDLRETAQCGLKTAFTDPPMKWRRLHHLKGDNQSYSDLPGK